jgi:lipopolysaccharide/colanic/teichoic acid biosynthesis glycosyltransferase
MIKRLFDLLLSALTLLILSPLMLALGLAVRAGSPGPAIFQQARVGRGGRPFRILKFRTMTTAQAVDAPTVTAADDARITRVGALLRRWKLDELPQLLNVLRGDMSLVGPRPEVPQYVALYPPHLRELILSVRPGITDEASIEFSNESALLAAAADPGKCYVEEIMPRKLELYARYARLHSLAGDLRILLRTVARVMHGGAQAGRDRASTNRPT